MAGRQRAAAAGASLVVACCAGLAAPAGSSAPSQRPNLKITIAANAQAEAKSRTWRLRCAPESGDWPAVGTACRRLTAALLRPIGGETKDRVFITSQPVRISGVAFGRTVSLRFPSRGSSTRRARLRALRTALGAAAYAEAQRRSR